MPMQIRRTPTPNAAPTGLAQGQLSVEMASVPPKLWVGVPTAINATGRIQLNDFITSGALTTALGDYVPLSGNVTMTGPITLAGNATNVLQPVTLQQLSGALADYATQSWVQQQLGRPPHVGTTPPAPPNAPGDLWMDESVDPPVLRVYDGTNWVLSTTPQTGFLPLTGGWLTGYVGSNSSIGVAGNLTCTYLRVFASPGSGVFDGQLQVGTNINCGGLIDCGDVLVIRGSGMTWPNLSAGNFIAIHPDVSNPVWARLRQANVDRGFLVQSPMIPLIQLNSGNATIEQLAASGGVQTYWAIQWSDRRLKENITPASDALGVVNDIAIHAADYTAPLPGFATQHWSCAFLADEVGAVIPEALIRPGGEDGYDALRELPLIATLWRAVQQLSEQVKELQRRR